MPSESKDDLESSNPVSIINSQKGMDVEYLFRFQRFYSRNRRHVERTMSARSQRGIHEAPSGKKSPTPRFSGRNREQKMSAITYDYDAAVSQPDVPNFLDLKKNGRYPMKRYQAPGTKRAKSNGRSRSSASRSADRATESVASGTSDDDKDEKENVTVNGVVDVENFTDFLKKTTDAQNLSYKITTIEVIGKGNDDQEDKAEDERSEENDKPGDSEHSVKSPIPQAKGSRIPRAKIVALPIQTVPELHPAKRITPRKKLKECTNSKCPPGCDQNTEISEKKIKETSQEEIKQDVVRFKETNKETKVVWDDERNSETEAADRLLNSSTDESPAITDGIDDPRVLSILQNLKLNCPCKTCTNQDLPSTSRPEDDSDSKSLSPEECKEKKWPLRRREYIDTSSEETSFDKSNDKGKKRKRSKIKTRSPLVSRGKSNSLVNASRKMSNRRNFSFFNTLFDIVFWPYVFLKSSR